MQKSNSTTFDAGRSLHSGTQPSTLAGWFAHFAQRTAVYTGHPLAFLTAVAIVAVWIVTGPIFNYSDTWQLVINTGTTIVTFLMVFLIQNTQNRDMLAVQLKLSELLLSMKGAKNEFAAIEDLSDDELEQLHNDCRARADMTQRHITSRRGKTGNGKHRPTKSKPKAGRHAVKA
ncbi:MAG: low affinity iron permease family protein [Pseudolabrys sp.]